MDTEPRGELEYLGMQIQILAEDVEQFKQVVRRGINTFPDPSPSLLELVDSILNYQHN